MSTLSCPRCDAQLAPSTIEGQDVLACPVAHGIWLAQEDLDRIVEDATDEATPEQEDAAWARSEIQPAELSTGRFRTCPACAQTLRKDVWKFGSGVVIDVCDEHGAWVERGEVERIEAWAEAWSRHASAVPD